MFKECLNIEEVKVKNQNIYINFKKKLKKNEI